jgi:hypothetical protein
MLLVGRPSKDSWPKTDSVRISAEYSSVVRRTSRLVVIIKNEVFTTSPSVENALNLHYIP